MRWIIIILLSITTAAQTGPHRKVFVQSLNCTNFPSSGIVEAITNGNIFWSGGLLTLSFTTTFNVGDQIEIVAENDSGNATAVPSISDSPAGLTWIPVVISLDSGTSQNRGIWQAIVGTGFTGTTVTINFHTTSSFSTQYSVTGVHISKSFIPSYISPSGNIGAYATVPNFTLNSSSVLFNAAGTTGEQWIFGGIAMPSTATYLHGLIIASIAGGATYSVTPPSGWTAIKVAGFPSSGIFYSCSFP